MQRHPMRQFPAARAGAAKAAARAGAAEAAGRVAAAAAGGWRSVQARPQQQHQTSVAAAAARPPPAAGVRAAASSGVERLPQNTENPLALPTPSLSPLQAVAAQLDALSADQLDAPWPLHGVGVAYAFCADSGSLDMSRYFAPMSTSLYHQDHFQGKFLTRFPGLVGHRGWRVEEEGEDGQGVAEVRVSVAPSSSGEGGEGGRHAYAFVMVKQEAGLRKGSWVTKQLVRLGEDGSVVVV